MKPAARSPVVGAELNDVVEARNWKQALGVEITADGRVRPFSSPDVEQPIRCQLEAAAYVLRELHGAYGVGP